MQSKLGIPWHKYGLIAELAKRLKGLGVEQFGKTMLQKLIFILQEVFRVDCGYSFSLYTYGPFCADILHDLDQVKALGGVKLQPVISETGGYNIEPDDKNDEIRRRAKGFLDSHIEKIKMVIADFGDLNARELELRSTLIYVAKHPEFADAPLSNEDLIALVHDIKPRFSEGEIGDVVLELQSKDYIPGS